MSKKRKQDDTPAGIQYYFDVTDKRLVFVGLKSVVASLFRNQLSFALGWMAQTAGEQTLQMRTFEYPIYKNKVFKGFRTALVVFENGVDINHDEVKKWLSANNVG